VYWLLCFSPPLYFGRISLAAADSTVVDSMPDFRHFTAADFMTAGLANSMTADFITLASFVTLASFITLGSFVTLASAVDLSWFPPSAAGGGAADGVGPIILQAEAITATDLMQVTGIIAPIRRATTPM